MTRSGNRRAPFEKRVEQVRQQRAALQKDEALRSLELVELMVGNPLPPSPEKASRVQELVEKIRTLRAKQTAITAALNVMGLS